MDDENSPAQGAGVDFRGSKNATQRVFKHIRPGKKRAPLLRYIRINLPRATRLLLVVMVAVIGAASAAVTLSNHEPFPFATPVLWGVVGAAALFVAVGLITSARIWTWGLMIALSSLLIYMGGLVGDAPYIWNGASIVSAAMWNLTLFASIGYIVLFGALRYRMIVAAPDNQHFMDDKGFAMDLGFPWWLRVEHFLNIIFISFLVRSGLEILGSYPKLYRSQHSVPGTSWAQFTIREEAKHKYYTVGDEYNDYSPRIALPGRGLLGLGRYWHFMTVTGFVTCWATYFVLLLVTGQWRRYVPTSWDTFSQAGQDMLAYLAFTMPHAVDGSVFNALQQLSYGFVILILTPLVIITGAFQSPAIANSFSFITRALGGRQVIRSVHFLCLIGYLAFFAIHVPLVFLHGYLHETSKMVLGHSNNPVLGGAIFTLGLVLVVTLHVVATRWTLADGRAVEKLHNMIVRPWSNLLYKLPARMHYDRSNITGKDVGLDNTTHHFRGSGRPPETDEYLALMANCYEDDYVLEIGGYVERPMTLTIAELRELAAGHSQTTLHHCVQGFTSIGRWRGISVSNLLNLVRPLPGATDVMYTSFQNMGRDDALYEGGTYYESTPMVEARMPQTMIAFELNDEGEIPAKNGAPVRLRLETSTGFRSLKWLERIEVVNRYDIILEGRGGFFEDADFFDRNQLI